MISSKFPESNLALAEDQPEYETLHVHVDSHVPHVPITSCFDLNKEEIDEIVRTGKIWHTQWTFGNPYQPISMSTQNPFTQTEADASIKS